MKSFSCWNSVIVHWNVYHIFLYQALTIDYTALLLQDAQTYAQENGLFFMETSAKSAANVNDIFYEIGK